MPRSAGWAIELKGHPVDLSDFERELVPPHSPWVERDGEILLLRSTTWADMSQSGPVMHEGRRLIGQLNGAARLRHDDAQEVQLGPLRRFDEAGQPLAVTIDATLCITEEGDRVRFEASTFLKDGTVQGPSFMQRSIAEADASDILAELLLHITRSNNWFDLYKAMELAELIMGGQHKLERAIKKGEFGAEWKIWENFRQTANHYRHAPPKANRLPDNPPSTPDKGLQRILPTIRRVVRGEL